MRALRLLLLLVLLAAPIGRIGMAEASAGHCAEPPAAAPAHPGSGHKQPAPPKKEGQLAIDCTIACAAMAAAPTPFVIPQARAAAVPAAPLPASLTGLTPEAATPPPRSA